MRKPVVLGVDPGQHRVGVAVRQGRDLVGWQLLTRPDGQSLRRWCYRVAARVVEIDVFECAVDLVAIENTKAPNPHVGRRRADGTDRGPRIIDPAPVLEATAVAWAVYGWLRGERVQMVDPAGFSATADQPVKILQAMFPADLVTTPKDELRDVRAAWLVAEAGERQHRMVGAPQ